MKKIALLLICLTTVFSTLWAQPKTITGKVTSEKDKTTIPGVSVSVKGTTLGTITDIDGNFSIKVPEDATALVFSFVGMQTKEIPITSTTINAVLAPDVVGLNEVVVTALGITREKKSLGYAVQEVKGDQVNDVKTDNFVSALSGKVSGVHVQNSTNFGGSMNVIIRGQSSLTQNNQALYVIDGVPIDNSNDNNSGQQEGASGYDYGNAASDVNPYDIASISVLKGAAATALYGSRAANGVILITTKKGRKNQDLGVRVSSNITISKIDKSTFPKYQTEYGAGYGPYYQADPDYDFDLADIDGDGTKDYLTPFYEDASRGEKFDSSLLVYQWNAFNTGSDTYGEATPWVAGAHGPSTFFETAVSTTNSVDISGGDKATTYRFSYTNKEQNGVMPNSKLVKNNALFTGTRNILDNLKLTTSANYIRTNGKGRPSTGYSDNILSSFRQWFQMNVDIKELEHMYKSTLTNATWNRTSYDDGTPAYWDNPYWVRFENYETDLRSRFIGYAKLDWDITDYLSAMGRFSIDTYSSLEEERKAVGSVAGELGVDRPDVTSGYSRFDKSFTETNADLMVRFHKKFGTKIDLSALLGANIRRTKWNQVFASTNNGLSVAGIYALSNSADPMLPPEEEVGEQGVNGYYLSASLGYKDMLFLDGTLRRDESSTLPSANNSYYYPSVTGSFIFSNLINKDWISMAKVRLNYAEVGNSAPVLKTKDTYDIVASFSGTSLSTVPDEKNNSNLKPERQKAYEGGLAMNFLNNRIGFDLALYENKTFDQLMPLSTSYATGYSAKWINAGKIENKGVELTINATPIKAPKFSWSVNINWSKNDSKVLSLYSDNAGNNIDNLQLGSLQGGITINAKVGEAYGSINGTDFVYNDEGQRLVDDDGYYEETSSNDEVLGNYNPDWTGGIQNSFSYKNWSLGFLIDMQHGGDVFSLDMYYGLSTGLYKETAGNNDLGNPKRDPIEWVNSNDESQGYASTSGGTIFKGVHEDGTENTTRIDNDNYSADGYAAYPDKEFVYDASFIKLREVTLTYRFNKDLLSKTFLSGASVTFVGSNLWIIHKNLPYADPESSLGSGNIQGWQSGVMPSTRNYGFTINLNF